jgi:1,2-diacylglycerol 3-alpha-glucosyltransferase
MRIAIFSDNFYPELSGIADSITLLARELSRMGHHVRFYVPRYAPADYQRVKQTEAEPDFGANVEVVRLPSVRYPTPTGQGRAVVPFGKAVFSLWRWKPDIIHTQTFFGPGIEALLAAWVLRVPIVGTNHTPLGQFLRYGPLHGPRFERLALGWVSWYYNRCRLVTAPSNFLFPQMEHFGLSKPHHAQSNPLDVRLFHPAADAAHRDALRATFGITGPALIYTGRLGIEKRVDVAIRAFAKAHTSVPEAQFYISGQGVAADQFKALARELGVGEAVRFMGFMDQHDMVALYQACDVFVVASTAETQCLSMLQAMACRMPVVAVRAGGLPEYVPSDVGTVVPPEDVDSMAMALTRLLGDAALRERMGAAGVAYVQQFSAHAVAHQWATTYEQVILDSRR